MVNDARCAFCLLSPTHTTLCCLRNRLVALVEQQAVPVIRAVLPEGSSAERAVALILIQLAGLVLSRYFLRYASVAALDRDTIIAEVGANVQRYLDGS